MTPSDLAALHAAAFAESRPWSAAEFADLLAQPGTFLTSCETGFALGRIILDEAELLTLAVAPETRRKGLGRALLAAFQQDAKARGARRAFLEVAADNSAALALYRAANWCESGRRKAYYRRPGAPAMDALLFEISLT